MSVNLGTGSNAITLANATNTGSLSNVQTLTGGTGVDTITLATSLVNGSIDLGAGADSLQLAAMTNRVSVANVETLLGGVAGDTIILSGANSSMVVASGGLNFVTGNAAADTFVIDQASAGNVTTILNFSTTKGDKIGLDTTGSGTLGTNTYDLGGAALVDLTNIKSVASAAARLATSLSTGGKGGFVYEQDTGELYYNAAGSFAGGGTLVAVVTTNGTTPWTYAANSFQQV
jgi:hypothetical protein